MFTWKLIMLSQLRFFQEKTNKKIYDYINIWVLNPVLTNIEFISM